MKRMRIWILSGLLALFGVVVGAGSAVLAEDVPQEKLDMIKSRCSSSQLAVRQIEKRDAVSRINRGRDYDQMLRHMNAFNGRFAYNKISAPDLLDLTTQIQAAVDKFRAAYTTYDNDLTNAQKVNCRDKPADYYDLIVRARDDRNAVGEQVRAIAELSTQYREAVLKYKDGVQ